MSACVTSPSNNVETANKIKKQIVGQNVDSLYSKWGAAESVQRLPSSNGKIYVWGNSRGCQNIVTTDNAGLITDFSLAGNCQVSK
jgi:hypothetical protein